MGIAPESSYDREPERRESNEAEQQRLADEAKAAQDTYNERQGHSGAPKNGC